MTPVAEEFVGAGRIVRPKIKRVSSCCGWALRDESPPHVCSLCESPCEDEPEIIR